MNEISDSVRELNCQETNEVSGGLDMSVGGAMIMSIGLAAGPIGIGAFALGLGLGVTMMVGGTMAEEGYS